MSYRARSSLLLETTRRVRSRCAIAARDFTSGGRFVLPTRAAEAARRKNPSDSEIKLMQPLKLLKPGPMLPRGNSLSFSAKLARLRDRLRDPEWRRYGKLLFA